MGFEDIYVLNNDTGTLEEETRNKNKPTDEQAILKREKFWRTALAMVILTGGYIGTFLKNFNADEEKMHLKIPGIELLNTTKTTSTAKETKEENIEQKIERTEILNKTITDEVKHPRQVINFTAPKIILDKKNCDALTNYWQKVYKEHSEYRKQLETAYAKISPWRSELEKIFESHGVPKEYIFIAALESNFNKETSEKGAKGYYQITDANAKKFGLKENERFDPLLSADVAARMIRENFERTITKNNPGGDWKMALTIYNGMNSKIVEALKSKGLELNFENYCRAFVESEINRIKNEIMADKKIPAKNKKEAFYKRISASGHDLWQNFQYAFKYDGIKENVEVLDASGKYNNIKPYTFTEIIIKQPEDIQYKTVKGDSLNKIAAKFAVSKKLIKTKNPDINFKMMIKDGLQLKIPSRQKLKTLSIIAEKEGVNLKILAEINPMFAGNPNEILPECIIRIPPKKPVV
jgi:LysM repeat protein